VAGVPARCWLTEQVIDGRCWRHEDTIVEQRDLVQWFLAHHGLCAGTSRGLDKLEGWPEKVRTMAAHWIGAQRGTEVDSSWKIREQGIGNREQIWTSTLVKVGLQGLDDGSKETRKRIRVFTTRVDTIFGATSVQLAPQHALVAAFTAADPVLKAQVDELIEQQRKAREAGDLARSKSTAFPPGTLPVNPYNGQRVPIWVANYILADYGTGAIMSVPAHDERDFEFCYQVRTADCRSDPPGAGSRSCTATAVCFRRRRAGELRRVQWASVVPRPRRFRPRGCCTQWLLVKRLSPIA